MSSGQFSLCLPSGGTALFLCLKVQGLKCFPSAQPCSEQTAALHSFQQQRPGACRRINQEGTSLSLCQWPRHKACSLISQAKGATKQQKTATVELLLQTLSLWHQLLLIMTILFLILGTSTRLPVVIFSHSLFAMTFRM